VSVGQNVHLAVEPAGWRLFDQAGEALALPPAPKERGGVQLPVLG
jgi:multiple sugar transport system ATP-binding protein